MLHLSKPTEQQISDFIAVQSKSLLTYKQVGTSRDGQFASGFGTDRVIGELGTGSATFSAAITAMKHWKQFDLTWVELFPQDAPIAEGTVVAVLAHHWFFWSLNSCRIIYVIDEATRFGFGYGTLAEHAEIGEERFLLLWDQATDKVHYDVMAFSKPHHWWGWLGLPAVRIVQNTFRRESQQALKAALSSK